MKNWFRYLLIIVDDVDAGVTTKKWRRSQDSATPLNVVQRDTVETGCPGTMIGVGLGLGLAGACAVTAYRSALASTPRDVARPTDGVTSSVQPPGGSEVFDVQVPPPVSSEDVI